MFRVRLVDGDIEEVMHEYEAEVAPRVGERLDWTADSGRHDILEVTHVLHRLSANRSDEVTLVGLVAVVRPIKREVAYDFG